ncbi:serine hydroxymethyltransferase [Periweissella fabaria]|uniref:Serine hydroxymethyltransferase n=1 Tax=Periweissella fabaria TaxID=546157 RepID=A0ABM8Z7G7_9LACO|nr:serine hydroxymethyltransferase [Periweissella fabaria]MCM0597902.1 serine hydroxymethyltransferase [Periweissella fabaria]CAH0417354.1 Serine hydroxymethyltransferase [Periweissella fabaria]
MTYQDQDPILWALIKQEEERQANNIELIASENIVSKGVRMAQGSVLTNKYSEGLPGARYYGGNEVIDEIETLAIERAKKLFGAEFANVQPYSGSQANAAVYQAFLQPGDTVLSMSLAAGGHVTHGGDTSFSGKLYNFVHYGVDQKTERLDYDAVLAQARKYQPKLIIAGASAYSRVIDFKRFRTIADEVGALLMVDMAHIAGLVATGAHPSPIPYADVVTSTTHKTLRGPRAGLILAKAQYADILNAAVFPGTQGGPHEHVIAGKAVAFGEELQPEFKHYIEQVLKNAAAMADEFTIDGTFRVITGGTDNHLLNIDITASGLNGQQAEVLLDSVGITTNKEPIPNETLAATSGIRIGSPAITTRGFDEQAARQVVRLIIDILMHHEQVATNKINYQKAVRELTAKYPIES